MVKPSMLVYIKLINTKVKAIVKVKNYIVEGFEIHIT